MGFSATRDARLNHTCATMREPLMSSRIDEPRCAGLPPRLAVVIPAWKAAFLAQAVDSVLSQEGDFQIFLGDDASPEDLRAVLGSRLDDPRITYRRFPENLGRSNLCAQWERCVDLAGEAEWIWLFSDDDVMGPGCIASALRAIEQNPSTNLVRFPVSCIDESGAVLREFPVREFGTPAQILALRLCNRIDSFAVEYVFRRTEFLRLGRFQHFDLAWGTDDSTWMKLMEDKPSQLLRDGRVYWRKSRLNISPDERNACLAIRKVRARIAWLRWLRSRYSWFSSDPKLRLLSRRWFFRNLEVRAFGYRALLGASREACDELAWRGAFLSGLLLMARKWFDWLGNRLSGKLD
jgi:glycosyltransferase involved in cell wall biosynthesis